VIRTQLWLTVSGEYKEQEREGTLRHRTRRVGMFTFRVNLGDVNAEGVTAELTDGVLTVRVPKAEKAKPHRVEITAA
jgi:HSP20 family protein